MSFISSMLGGQQKDPTEGMYVQDAGQLNLNRVNQNALQGRMQGFENQLQTQAAGGGPSVATTMLNNAQQQNAAQANAMAASQRGVNPGLALRSAMQSNAGANQAAQAQGVAARQQEQLNAQQMLGQNQGAQASLVNTMQGQGYQNQQYKAGLQAQASNANAERAQKASSGAIGGLANMAGAAFGMADGGDVPNTAIPQLQTDTSYEMFGGGSKDSKKPKGDAKASAAPQAAPNSPMGTATVMGDRPAPVLLNQPIGPQTQAQAGPQSFIGRALGNAQGHLDTFGSNMSKLGTQLGFAQGGTVPALVSPGERYLPPSEVKKVEKGEKSPMKAGEKIPGKPKVGGATNSYANDTVHKKLKEGGIILPRAVTMSPDAEKKAMAFMKALQAKRGAK